MINPYDPPQADLHGPDVPASGPRRSIEWTVYDALGGTFWLAVGVFCLWVFKPYVRRARQPLDAIIGLFGPALLMVAGGLILLLRALRGRPGRADGGPSS